MNSPAANELDRGAHARGILGWIPRIPLTPGVRLARFERETRTVAALYHPNVVTLFAIEEANSVRFLAMELVEGQSLDRLVPPGSLPFACVLDLAVPLADALTGNAMPASPCCARTRRCARSRATRVGR